MKNRKANILIASIFLVISYLLFLFFFPHWQIRRILNEEYLGWFGPGYVIDGPLTIAEIETQSLAELSNCTNCPQTPFGFVSDHWKGFKASIQEGDEIYYFLSDPASWRGLAGREGYVLVRNGKLIKVFITMLG